MVVLRPLAGMILLFQLQTSSLARPDIVENSTWLINTSTFWLIFLVIAALSIYAGLKLWRDRSPAAVRMAIIILWVYSPLAAADILIAKAFQEQQVTLSNAVSTIVTNLAIAAVWTLYLKRSLRVRNTYFRQVDY